MYAQNSPQGREITIVCKLLHNGKEIVTPKDKYEDQPQIINYNFFYSTLERIFVLLADINLKYISDISHQK